MNLTQRLQGNATARHKRDGASALDDSDYATMLGRARIRLARQLTASVPDIPELSASDIDVLAAFERHGLAPVTVVLFGQDRIGAKQIAARLHLRDGVPHVKLGVAVMDEYGDVAFREEQAPPPLCTQLAG